MERADDVEIVQDESADFPDSDRGTSGRTVNFVRVIKDGETSEGVLSINYTGLIPVLVEAIKDLQERMEKFERGNKGISLQRGEVSENTDNTALGQTFKDEEYLSQNVPNPVDDSTVINYRLPEGATRASIVVYSTNGAVVKTIPLDLSGTNGSITLYTSDLAKGVNLYQLTVNEVILGTKKLINP